MSVFGTRRQNGFTMVELLVAMAVIAILATIVYGTMGGMRERSRDAQRVSDIEQIRLALRLYKDTYGTYPDYDAGITIGTGGAIDNALSSFFGTIPTDPLGSGVSDYVYDSDFNCPTVGTNVIILYAEDMERSSNDNWVSVCNGVAPGADTYAVILER